MDLTDHLSPNSLNVSPIQQLRFLSNSGETRQSSNCCSFFFTNLFCLEMGKMVTGSHHLTLKAEVFLLAAGQG